ncbi:hypothetical protein [Natrinema caseinilyticum]|uniref:hypothetical protein n=1 Tax=Natrinema caseinilyticum TaxID=2961570 RepID=UPI0020C41A91|nr:hypothetical protein [Natrinema caseinilyticum]
MSRTDDMHEGKCVKLYPSQAALHLAGYDGLDASSVQFVLRREGTDTDRIELRVGGDESEAPSPAEIRRSLSEELLVTMDEIEIVDGLEVERSVVDDRYHSNAAAPSGRAPNVSTRAE